MIAIVDYEVGNLGSIQNMLKKIGVQSSIVSGPDALLAAEKVILPGVGSYDTGMTKLKDKGFIDVLNHLAFEKKIPVLGICLGMQLMTRSSEEGNKEGLGWFDATTPKFSFEPGSKLKVPNMGWNYVTFKKKSKLSENMFEEPKFYFVHSYYVKAAQEQDILATAHYGFEYCCALEKDNLYGVQFHPEKSHKYGMQLLRNFSSL